MQSKPQNLHGNIHVYLQILQPLDRKNLVFYFRCKPVYQQALLANRYVRCESSPIRDVFATGSTWVVFFVGVWSFDGPP